MCWVFQEAIVNSFIFWNISSTHCGAWNVHSVLQFCRAEHLEVARSWWRSSWLRKHPVAIVFLLVFVFFEDRRFFDAVALGIVSQNSNNSTLPISRIIVFDSTLRDCRCYFVANRLEVLVNEDDTWFHKFANMKFSACVTTACGCPDTLKTMFDPRVLWTNRWIVHFERVASLFLHLDFVGRWFGLLDIESNSFIQLSSMEICGGSRGDAYTSSYMILQIPSW